MLAAPSLRMNGPHHIGPLRRSAAAAAAPAAKAQCIDRSEAGVLPPSISAGQSHWPEVIVVVLDRQSCRLSLMSSTISFPISVLHAAYTYTRCAKTGPQTHDSRLLSNVNRFSIFLSGRFLGKFAVKCILTNPPHLAYVATLPCETLMSAKQAINDKLPGSVAAYLRYGGVVNKQIRKGLLVSLTLKKN